MITWGITALSHDAAITVLKDDEIVFAAHAERYSKVKFDSKLNIELIAEAMQFGCPDVVSWADRPIRLRTRQFIAGQPRTENPYHYMKQFLCGVDAPIEYQHHHKCHAAAGFYTSPFDSAAIVIIDSIGEFDTITTWKGDDKGLHLIRRVRYPNSVGLLYSAFTKRLGLDPNSEEYVMMGMAGYGDYTLHIKEIKDTFIKSMCPLVLKKNVHTGIGNFLPNAKDIDIAAAIQALVENIVLFHIIEAQDISPNLVYGGGVALNCKANTEIRNKTDFKNIWIYPNPGDAGNSLGAAILVREHKPSNGECMYLGTNIAGSYNPSEVVDDLMQGNVVGIANGRAEFGPRALGNRSLLADPRDPTMKDTVNEIKRRQKFRPFSPMILEEECENYFDLQKSPYMQFAIKPICKFDYPAVKHVDGTCRVQTINESQNPIYAVVKEFYERTGCPMLLNTSLNIRGEPMVNSVADARRFEAKYNVKVYGGT